MKKKVFVFILIIPLLLMTITNCASKKDGDYSRRLKPGSVPYLIHQGINYLNSGNLAMAEKSLTKVIEKDATQVVALNGLGIINLKKRKLDEATQYFRRVIQITPNYFDAYNYLGVICAENGKYELAKENYLIAANAEKYHTPENAYANLAMLEISQKKYDSAMRYVQKGLQLKDDFPSLYNAKGIILEQRGQYSRAVFNYEKALSLLITDDVSILINIGRTYGKLGNKNKALDTLEKALVKANTPQIKQQIRTLLNQLDPPASSAQNAGAKEPVKK